MLDQYIAAPVAGCVFACLTSLAAPAFAQQTESPPILVITATRSPLSLAKAGSAVTVIGRDEIEKWGTGSVADVLRGVEGLDITENGGPGSLTNLSLRGSNPDQTLILVDGIRIGDPSSIGGEFDFGAFSTNNIERIEIVRGPQSALYGSDAMGGVVNIITRKGANKRRTSIALEGGSYGTLATRMFTSGGTEKLSYAFSFSGFRSSGFSRYGYRIGRIAPTLAGPLERDGTRKLSGSAHVTYRPAPGTKIEVGFRHFFSSVDFDNPGAFLTAQKDTRFNRGRQNITQAFVRGTSTVLDGRLTNTVTLFGTWTKRGMRLERSCFDALFFSYDCKIGFFSRRLGAEYQGNLKLGNYGLVIFGLRGEREEAFNAERIITPPSARRKTFTGSQTTTSAFALYQKSFGRLNVSAGTRFDSVDGKTNFLTWRLTSAYNIFETGTKLRASIGTGAKAPTLYRRFSIYGNANLKPEELLGYDVGIDQYLFNQRIKLSLTAFEAKYRNLVDFNPVLNAGVGGFFNIGRARIRGVEAAGRVTLVPQIVTMHASYTYLEAINETTGNMLLRRPRHKGRISVVYTGIPKLQVEGRLTLVGDRIDRLNDFPYGRTKLARYAKADIRASYKLNNTFTLFARAENITNARYEEIRDYGVAGRSFYVGLRGEW